MISIRKQIRKQIFLLTVRRIAYAGDVLAFDKIYRLRIAPPVRARPSELSTPYKYAVAAEFSEHRILPFRCDGKYASLRFARPCAPLRAIARRLRVSRQQAAGGCMGTLGWRGTCANAYGFIHVSILRTAVSRESAPARLESTHLGAFGAWRWVMRSLRRFRRGSCFPSFLPGKPLQHPRGRLCTSDRRHCPLRTLESRARRTSRCVMCCGD